MRRTFALIAVLTAGIGCAVTHEPMASNAVCPDAEDCCGPMFGVFPGIATVLLDFSTGTLYYTREIYGGDSAAATDIDRESMTAVKPEDMSREGIDNALSEALQTRVTIESMRMIPIVSL